MRFSQDFLNEVAQRVDLVDLIDEVVPLKKQGKNYFACCPFHDEKSPSFSVEPEEQFYYCHGACGSDSSGGVFDFYQQYHRATFPEAVKALAAKAGLELPKTNRTPTEAAEAAAKAGAYRTLEQATSHYQKRLSHSPEVVQLLKKRNIGQDTAKRFALGAAANEWRDTIDSLGGWDNRKALVDSGLAVLKKRTETKKGSFYDRFRNGLIFPIRDEQGRTVSLGQRRLNDPPPAPGRSRKPPPKYLNGPETPVFNKGAVAYGLYEMRQAGQSTPSITVAEGYMDVITAHQSGFSNTVGTMGTSIRPETVGRLFRHTDTLTFCFDGDNAGQKAAQRALSASLAHLDDQKSANFVFLPQGEDVDSFINRHGPEAYQKYLDTQAVPASEYILRLSNTQVGDINTSEGRGQFFANAKSLLDQMPPSGAKSNLLHRLESITNIRPSEYMPYSVQMSDGAYEGVDLGALEEKVRGLIAQETGAPVADVKVNWSMPEIGPRPERSEPRIDPSEGQKAITNKMREVGRVLSLEGQVTEGLSVGQLLNKANNATGDSQKMAKGLLQRYMRDSNAFDTECNMVRHHLRSIREDVAALAPTMDNERREALGRWVDKVQQHSQQLGALTSMADPVTADKIEEHIQTFIDSSEAARHAAMPVDRAPQAQQTAHPQSPTIRSG